VPTAEGEQRPRIRLEGDIPSAAEPPSGCVFHTRCPRFIGDVCVKDAPPLREVEPGHFWRCHYSADELRELQREPPDQAEANAKRAAATNGSAPVARTGTDA
jgi:peptide/nickel transport system ATP-binding protein